MQRVLTFSYFCLVALLLTICAKAQSDDINWRMNVKMASATEGEIIIKAIIEPGWHLYGMNLPKEAGPKPTTINFDGSKGISFTSELKYSPEAVEKLDPMFNTKLNWWENNVTFRRKFKIAKQTGCVPTVTATITYMVCDNKTCQRPTTKTMSKTIKQ